MSNTELTMQQQQISRDVVDNYILSLDNSDKLSKQQKDLFYTVASSMNLNPIKKQIYAIPYHNKKTGKHELTVVIDYKVYLKKAQATGKLDGYNVDIKQVGGKPSSGKITIYRKDMKHPIVLGLLFQECAKTFGLWTSQPVFMFRKTLIKRGMETAFPEDIDDIAGYDEEEAGDTKETIQHEAEVIEEYKAEVVTDTGEVIEQAHLLSDAQRRKMFAMSTEYEKLGGIIDMSKYIEDKFGHDSSAKLTKIQASNIIEMLDKLIEDIKTNPPKNDESEEDMPF